MSTENLSAAPEVNTNPQPSNPEPANNPQNSDSANTEQEKKVEGQQDDNKKPEEQQEEKPEHKNGWQKRVDKLTSRVYKAEAENAELRKVVQQLIPKDDEGKPTIEYNTQHSQAVQAAEFNAKIAEAKEVYQDYDQATKALDKIPVTPALESAILESEYSGHVLYELSKNPSIAMSLVNASEREVNRTIGRIEAQIESRLNQPATLKQPAPKPVTNAPEPIKPVSSGSAKTEFDHLKHPEKYTADEWRRLERERVEKLHKR